MTSKSEIRGEPKQTLQTIEVHTSWMTRFRTPENDRFFGMAFDYIADCFGQPGNDVVLDAGCGSGTKSLQLARRGYHVLGLDFSAAILEEARRAAANEGLGDRIKFGQGDITALAIPSGSMRRVVCWGVLMHVSEVDRAIAELARVLAPGGTLIVSESNCWSLQAVMLRHLRRVLGKQHAEIVRTPAGIEVWEPTDAGRLMTRQSDVPRLVAEFEKGGLKLVSRRAGQFTEIYTRLPWKPIRDLVHGWNHFWFRWVCWGGAAFGNILTFVKPT